jgi:transcriptional regulator with XRE-family HTH domain
MTIVNKRIGSKLRKIRVARGITQEELAYSAGIDYSFYNQIENGKRNTTVRTLTKICRVLKIKVKDIF